MYLKDFLIWRLETKVWILIIRKFTILLLLPIIRYFFSRQFIFFFFPFVVLFDRSLLLHPSVRHFFFRQLIFIFDWSILNIFYRSLFIIFDRSFLSNPDRKPNEFDDRHDAQADAKTKQPTDVGQKIDPEISFKIEAHQLTTSGGQLFFGILDRGHGD